MQTDTQVQSEPELKLPSVTEAAEFFAKAEAKVIDYRIREELRSLGFMVALPQDEDE